MEFKNRNNANLKKKDVLDFIFNTVDGRTNPVDLKSADLYVIVEVYRDLLMIGVVPHYKELKKYNLQSLVKSDNTDGDDNDE
jgi:tRNA(Ser,Leu) C12 N-acetylase TAN1